MTLMKFARAGAVAMGALAITTTANAADLYGGGGLKDAPFYGPGPSWAGFYLGGSFGSAWGNLNATDANAYHVPAGVNWDNATSGIYGGAQIGYNLQYGGFVLGPEADFGGMDLDHSRSDTPGDVYNNSHIGGGFYLDATGRLGYAVGPILSYMKGGYAYYDGPISYNTGAAATTKSVSGVDGWTLAAASNIRWALRGA